MAAERFSADISANIRKFQQKMAEVDRIIRQTANDLMIEVEAQTKEAQAKFREVQAKANELAATEIDVEVEAITQEAEKNFREIQAKATKLSSNDIVMEVEAKTREAEAKFKEIQAKATTLSKKDIEMNVTLETSEYMRKMLKIRADLLKKRELEVNVKMDSDNYDRQNKNLFAKIKAIPNKVRVKIDAIVAKASADVSKFKTKLKSIRNRTRAKVDAVIKGALRDIQLVKRALKSIPNYVHVFVDINSNFDKKMGVITAQIGTFATIVKSAGVGSLVAMIPALSSLGAAAVGTFATIVGAATVATGALIGFVGAMGAFATGLGAFGVTAFQSIKTFTDDELPLLGDSAEEYHALKSAVDSLKQSHKRLSGAVEAKHFVAFKNVLNTVTKLMNRLEPLTVGMADAMVDLSSRFNKALDSKPIRNFLDMVNRDAVPIFKTMATAFGHFGIAAINIFTALSPMTKAIASGFGAMAERVATWSHQSRHELGLNYQ